MSSNYGRCYNQLFMKALTSALMLAALLSSIALGQKTQQKGQQRQPQKPVVEAPARAGDDQTLSVNVDLVNILFTVADRRGKFVTNLKKDDFRVFEDERPQTITNFSSETDLPLTIALLVDTSGSIRDKLQFEQRAATEFFYATLQRGKDKAMIISFDSGVDLIQDFTDDP